MHIRPFPEIGSSSSQPPMIVSNETDRFLQRVRRETRGASTATSKKETMNSASTVRTVATRVGAKRTMSTTPKMHKAKDVWKQLESTRPPEGHPHVSIIRTIVVAVWPSLGDG